MCTNLCIGKSQENLLFHVEYKKGKCGRAKMCKFGSNTVEKITLKIAIK